MCVCRMPQGLPSILPNDQALSFANVRGFPGSSDIKASAYNAGDLGSIPGSRKSPGDGNGNPLQYSCLENPMDGGAWWAAYSPWGREEADTRERLHFHFSLACIGERNGNPLQCSCLENRRDGGAWWAAVCGVAQGRTRLKRQQRRLVYSGAAGWRSFWRLGTCLVGCHHLYVCMLS